MVEHRPDAEEHRGPRNPRGRPQKEVPAHDGDEDELDDAELQRRWLDDRREQQGNTRKCRCPRTPRLDVAKEEDERERRECQAREVRLHGGR